MSKEYLHELNSLKVNDEFKERALRLSGLVLGKVQPFSELIAETLNGVADQTILWLPQIYSRNEWQAYHGFVTQDIVMDVIAETGLGYRTLLRLYIDDIVLWVWYLNANIYGKSLGVVQDLLGGEFNRSTNTGRLEL